MATPLIHPTIIEKGNQYELQKNDQTFDTPKYYRKSHLYELPKYGKTFIHPSIIEKAIYTN